MPLSAATIQATLESKLTAAGFNLTDTHSITSKLAKAIAETIYTEITSNALVTVTVTTTGSPSAQAGGGTGTIA